MAYSILKYRAVGAIWVPELVYDMNGQDRFSTSDYGEARAALDRATRDFGFPGSNVARYALFELMNVPIFRNNTDIDWLCHRIPFLITPENRDLAFQNGWQDRLEVDPSKPLMFEEGTRGHCSNRTNTFFQARVPDGGLKIDPNGRGCPGDGWWSWNVKGGGWNGGEHRYWRCWNAPSCDGLPDVQFGAVGPEAEAEADSEAVELAPVFEVRCGISGTERDNWAALFSFDNGKEAADFVKARKSYYAERGKVLAIVKVDPAELAAAASEAWHERERERLANGEYLPLPGAWADRIARDYPHHYAHLANGNKLKVAFTEGDKQGARDVQKVLSAQEYAERYFSPRSMWNSVGARWEREVREQFVGDILGDGFAPLMAPLGDSEALVSIYTECHNYEAVSSCMSYSKGHFCGDAHPVEVYSQGGEITLAFLRGERGNVDTDAAWDDNSIPIVARCLVWIKDGENKQFGRLYGDCTHTRLLRTCLQAQGFKEGSLDGARLARIEYVGREVIMPYLDIGGGMFSDGSDGHFVAGGDQYCGDSTGGTAYCEPRATCERCEEYYDAEDGREVQTGRWGSETWCGGCTDYHAFYCDYLSEYVSDDYQAQYTNRRGYEISVAEWVLEDGEIDDVALTESGDWVEGATECEDCELVLAPDELDSDGCCDGCAAERAEAAEAEAEAAAEAEAEAAAEAA